MTNPPPFHPSASSASGAARPWRLAPVHEPSTPLFNRMRLGGLEWEDLRPCLGAFNDVPLLDEQALWHELWSTLGHTAEELAMKAGGARARATRQRMLLRSAACHHFAQLLYFDNPEAKFMTRRRVTRLFESVSPLLPHEVRSLRIPYEDFSLPAYLLAASSEERTPCVLLVNDLGTAKEIELYALAREFLAHGVSVLLFDGPGQGELAGLHRLTVPFEQVVAAVLDSVCRLPQVDPERLGICGLGHGGYLAARAAALLPQRLQACVSISGGHDHDHYARLPELAREELKYAYCLRSDTAMARLAREELSLRGTPRLKVPLLVIQDPEDSAWPLASSIQLLSWARGDRDFMCLPLEQLALASLGPWMARALSRADA
jgi:dienelactone hydrolase